jgi:hypothetical protein
MPHATRLPNANNHDARPIAAQGLRLARVRDHNAANTKKMQNLLSDFAELWDDGVSA